MSGIRIGYTKAGMVSKADAMQSPIDSEESLARILQLALRAGEAILEVYATDFVIDHKADASPVTEADRRAEAIILAGLGEIAPDVPVIAEEEAAAGHLPDAGDVFFLVDPLDGTREFLARNGEFTVNIALIRNGSPVMGVVYAPTLGTLFCGKTGGAFKTQVVQGKTERLQPIHVRRAPPRLDATGSRTLGAAACEDWLKRFPDTSFIAIGSSLKFCMVAEGAADIYPRFGRTMEWDTAAGDAILRAAGGQVVTLDGKPLAYGKRADGYANPHFVAYGDPDLGPAVSRPMEQVR